MARAMWGLDHFNPDTLWENLGPYVDMKGIRRRRRERQTSVINFLRQTGLITRYVLLHLVIFLWRLFICITFRTNKQCSCCVSFISFNIIFLSPPPLPYTRYQVEEGAFTSRQTNRGHLSSNIFVWLQFNYYIVFLID